MIQNICPAPGEENRQENTGSTFLEFHTENGFHPLSPDFLALLCLRPDHDRLARTAVASVRNAIHRIPGKVVDILREPLFRVRMSSSFTGSVDAAPRTEPIPVLRGDPRSPMLCVDAHAMHGETVAAQQALDRFIRVLMESADEIRLERGDLLVVDNRIAAHARTAFTPRFDGYDRWLQRMSVLADGRRAESSCWPGSYTCVDLPIEWAWKECRPNLPPHAAA